MPVWGLSGNVLALGAGVVVGGLLIGGVLPALVDEEGRPKMDNVVAGDQPLAGPATGDSRSSVQRASEAEPTGTSGSGGAPVGSSTGGRTAVTTAGRGQTASPAVSGASGPITVGVLLIDLGNVGRVGFGAPGLNPREQEAWYNIFFKEINDTGGIGGRPVTGVYAPYDPLSADSQRAACLALTEDRKAFAVLENTAGYRGPNVLCFTEEHGTPFISTFHRHNREEMRKSGDLLFGYGMSAERNLASAAHVFHGMGTLKGKKIGIIESSKGGDSETTDFGLVRTLDSLGYKITKRFVFSENLDTASSQVPVAVQQMSAAGVDALFMNVNVVVGTQFASAAEGQLYRPQYLTHEWNGVGTDFGAKNMPPSFNGALAVVSERDGEFNVPGRNEPAPDRNCREHVKRVTGEDYPLNSDQNAVIVQTCAVVRLYAAAARAAGPNGDRKAFTDAMQRLGPVDPPRVGPGFFQPGRFDAATHVRTKRWDNGCKCWKIVRDFEPARV